MLSNLQRCLFKISIRNNRHGFLLITLLFAAAVTLRALAAGFEYLPLLDDSIQYINYPTAKDYGALIESEGLFSSRPLAALIDLYFVGQLNSCFILPLIIFSLMHGIAGALFMRLFSRIFGTGAGFAVVYALLPLGVEGVYWLSASSRIVTGLFFAAIAANLLEDFINSGGILRIAAFPVAALISYGFYEQILVVSFTLSMLQLIRSFRRGRAWAALLVFPMLALYFIFTGMNVSDSALGSRMEFVSPVGNWYYENFFPVIVRQIGAAFIKGGVRTLFFGFVRGMVMCFSGFGGIIYLMLSLAAGACLYFLTRTADNDKTQPQRAGEYIWGILLFLAPITPYFVIANPWFSIRSTVPSYIGAGLIIDALLRLILRRKNIYAVVCGAAAAVFLIAGGSEVRDFHAVAEYDEILAGEILENAPEMNGRVGILCVEQFPFEDQNYSYHDHCASVGSSDWALYGKLVAKNKGELSFYPVPLASIGFSFYHGWNTSMKRISGFDEIWLWDNTSLELIPLDAVKQDSGEHDYNFYFEDGTPWGHVFEEDDYGYIEIYGG